MPDVGRFSKPFTSTLPTLANQALYAKDVEPLLYWLTQEAASHGWPAPQWKRQLGTDDPVEFAPQNAAPFGLIGTDWNARSIWNQIRDYFGTIGPNLFQDFVAKNPYGAVAWNPADKSTIGKFGKVDINHARSLIGNVHPFPPTWTTIIINKSTAGFGNSANGFEATASIPANGTFENSVNTYDFDGVIAAAINGAWAEFQAAPWQFFPSVVAGLGAELSLQIRVFGGPPYPVTVTVGLFSQIEISYRWIGEKSLKNSIGMIPLDDGTLPIGVTTQTGNGSASFVWNPWGYSSVLAYGTAGASSAATQAEIVDAILAALPGSTLYTIPEPPTAPVAGLPGYNGSTFTTLHTAAAADFAPAQNVSGGNWFWVASFSNSPWVTGSSVPTLPSIAGSALNPAAGPPLALGFIATNTFGIQQLISGTGYTIGPTFVQSQSSGSLGTALPFAG